MVASLWLRGIKSFIMEMKHYKWRYLEFLDCQYSYARNKIDKIAIKKMS